jgi:hypothetical protein
MSEYWCGTCGITIETFAEWNANHGDCLGCREWWDAQGPCELPPNVEVAAMIEAKLESRDDTTRT